MDAEVRYSIGKYLTKLEKLWAVIYVDTNVDNTGSTEEVVTFNAKGFSQLKKLSIFI
jgi:hypothetical protein